MLTTHLEVTGHRHHQPNSQRRVHLEASTSAQSALPALAGFAGLSTPPFLLYKMIGFDILHVRAGGARGLARSVSVACWIGSTLLGCFLGL